MSPKIYLNVLKTGVFISLICVFFVFKNLLFPYITSKQIPFNIIVEILLIFWIALIAKYPEYRPKKSYITFGLIAFFTAILISCFTGVDFNLSFWGDVERMLGVFHILHFFGLYLIIITVFRNWQDWKWLFLCSTICAFFVSLMGLGEKAAAYSTIGNTAYLSAYLIFNIYFSIWLFIKEENKVLRWLYLIPLPVFLIAFNKADTTGAFVGLGFSVLVALFMMGVLAKNKKIKIATLSILAISVIFTVWALNNRNSDALHSIPLLNKVAGINFQARTFQTRLISWQAAFKDFKNHPILGTGFGNYAITFDKYFKPNFYNYTRQETYFDRAHNNLIDIATTTGLAGLLAYLSIFIALAYYLIRGYIKKMIDTKEFILITSLMAAYFVQNLAVFDSFVTYQLLMLVLGYVYWITREKDSIAEKVTMKVDKYFNGPTNKEYAALLISGFILLLVVYQYNYKPYLMLKGTIDGQIAYSQGNIEGTVDAYKNALSYKTGLDRDSRTSLIRLFAGNSAVLKDLDATKRKEIYDYTIDLAEKNVAYNTNDSLNQMLLGQLLNTAAESSTSQEDFDNYSNKAMEAMEKSIAASPGRVPIFFEKAQIYLVRGDKENALKTLEYAYSLNPEYYDSSCHLGNIYLFYKDEKNGYKYMDECVDLGGASLLSNTSMVKNLLNYYTKKEDWVKVIKLTERLTVLEPKEYKAWINLANLYSKTGDKEKAVEAANKAAEVNPDIKSAAENFIKSIK